MLIPSYYTLLILNAVLVCVGGETSGPAAALSQETCHHGLSPVAKQQQVGQDLRQDSIHSRQDSTYSRQDSVYSRQDSTYSRKLFAGSFLYRLF
jgi:hypothetical protein